VDGSRDQNSSVRSSFVACDAAARPPRWRPGGTHIAAVTIRHQRDVREPPFWRMSRLLGEPDRDAQNELFW